jgi:putative protein-disulfide isomerase
MKLLFLLPFILFSNFTSHLSKKSMEKPEIIYVYDALCGWCYGFSPVMEKFYDQHKNEYKFTVISGGMITGSRIGPLSEMAEYIGKAYKDVEKASGVKFGEVYLKKTLKEGKVILTSEPSAKALCVYKSFNADNAVKFASALQKAIYFDGADPSDIALFASYAQKLGVDGEEFKKRMQDESFTIKAKEEFNYSSQLGVTGFPTVFIKKDNKISIISGGFCTYENLEQRVKSALAQ